MKWSFVALSTVRQEYLQVVDQKLDTTNPCLETQADSEVLSSEYLLLLVFVAI